MGDFILLVVLGTLGIIAGIVYGLLKCSISYFKAFSYSFNRKYSLKIKSKFGEPAAEKYFFNKQYEDLLNTYESAKSINSGNILILKEQLKTKSYFTYYKVKSAQKSIYMLGNVVNVICVLVHFIIVTVISIPTYLFYAIVLGIEKFISVKKNIACVCPKCLSKFDIPYYICPNCGRVHKMLTPGPYGIIKRQCKCKQIIPCTNLGGRFKLEAVCPLCGENIETREASPVCIPVVGPEFSGKTSVIYCVIDDLIYHISKDRKWEISFLNKNCKDKIKKCLEYFKEGVPVEEINDVDREVYNIFVNSPNFSNEKILYFYDTKGKYFNSKASIRVQKQYGYISVIVFVIDIMCIRIKEGCINIHDFMDRFIMALREINEIKPKNLISIPAAIVINKKDSSDYNVSVEDFLKSLGEDTLLKKFECNFSRYKFFSYNLHKYEPNSLEEIIMWILSEANSEFKF